MLRLMQLKYPYFPTKMSLSHAEASVRNFCYVSEHYTSELRSFRDSASFLNDKDCVIQYPIPESSYSSVPDEDQSKLLEERKKAFSEKMKLHSEKRKQEKIVALKSDLVGLREMQATRAEYETEDDYLEMLKDYGYSSISDLEQVILDFETRLDKLVYGKDSSQKETVKYDYSILEIPDADLSEEKIKEKRKLRLLKAGFDARERARLEKEDEDRAKEKEELKENMRREADPEKWIAEKRALRSQLKSKLKQLKQERDGLSDRKSSSSIRRIKSLSTLVNGRPSSSDFNDENASLKKKRKAGQDTRKDKSPMDDDPMFGDNESDWSIYRELNKAPGTSDDSFEDLERLENEIDRIDELLSHHDPNFWNLEQEEKKASFIDHFTYGIEEASEREGDSNDTQNRLSSLPYQLHINIERIRVPEILFQPSIIGLGSMGIVETLNETFAHISKEHDITKREEVFLTGGNVAFPGFPKRLFNGLRSMRPSSSILNILSPQFKEPSLDDISASNTLFNSPWRGAAKWASKSHGSVDSWISRAEYEEEGIERCISRFRSAFFIH
ncbi:putative chromatin remodeling complex subunit protein [Mitosporidium daphniae]|uniref:Putative chromatin remodeling complex subunit protein n=1 Tax=Mitosporidium daphniae TaxID=1485682 RepID=A0A098VWD4_9MICR|nr:putative chromatin remodeling complex subunit protein [Mitosporidium daphniae]KGG52071.1 putative chromatin remodeling complex subunit protein [Mitosporidium daphniae]|eukprot:XP_013238507.1 putative chromatin remodeling complex subunit protein [Mitosporidium daphniae]